MSTTPIAPRGGVMLLPLTGREGGGEWPTQLTLRLDDGRSLEGVVGWIHAGPSRRDPAAGSSWTRDPRGLSIRPPVAGDELGRTGSAVLFTRVPEDGAGAMFLGRQRLEPIWHDRPLGAKATSDDRAALPRVPAFDRPDADSPFEHWRWVLLAQRLDQRPPSADTFDLHGTLLAEHFADLWLIGLERLAAESPGLAQHVRELLTRVCTDGDVPFAAWVADPAATNALLSHLLNTRRASRAIIDDVLAWVQEQERVRFWIETDAGDAVRLALVNPGARPVLVRFDWTSANEPPIAVEVQPGTLRRVVVDRPQVEPPSRHRPLERAMAEARRTVRPDVLAVTAGGRTVSLPMRPSHTSVLPPGFWLPPARPPLSLAEFQGSPGPLASRDGATTALVRRLRGRWEVFIESRRPVGASSVEKREQSAPKSIDDARGQEALILTVSRSSDDVGNVLIIPEEGWHHLARGSHDGTLQIHRRSYDDHWVCRVVLPDAWLGLMPGERTFLAVMRTRQGTPRIDFSPTPALPWRQQAAAAALDLSEWLDLPLGQ